MKQSIVKGSGNGKRRALAQVWVCLVLMLAAGCASPGVKNTSRTFRTVIIDAGHGGADSGARTRWAGSEKYHTMDVANRLEPKLRQAGFRTVMTRRGDNFVELNERARISNAQNNAVFVSIHFNHSSRRSIRGAEVYYKSPESREMAQRLLSKVSAVPGARSRGLKTANFRVLKLNEYPAVLVECGYLTCPVEGRRCASPGYRELLAEAIARGLVEQRGPIQ